MNRYPVVLLALLSGLLFGFAQVMSWTWWLYIPAMVLLFVAIQAARHWRQAFWAGLIAGTGNYAGAVIWFWNTYPIDWFSDIAPAAQLVIIGLFWITVAVSMGVGTGFFAVVARMCQSWWLYAVPLLWVTGEVIGSLVFSVYTWGPGSAPNGHFSFGYLGYLVTDMPGAFSWAAVGGVYALSVVACMLALTALLLYQHLFRSAGIYVGVLSFFTCLLMFSATDTYTSPDASVIVVDTRFESHMFIDQAGALIKKQEILAATAAAVKEQPDYVVLPEDSRFVHNFVDPALAYAFLLQFSNSTIVIDSARVTDERGETVLRAFIYDLKDNRIYTLDKQYLVPQGEFLTYVHSTLFSLLADDAWYEQVVANQSYRPGPHNSYTDIPETVPAVLFCMESSSAFSTARLARTHQAPFIAHPVSHAWFQRDFVLSFALERMLAVQAMWANLPIIKSGNMSEGALYTHDGLRSVGTTIAETEFWRLQQHQI